MIAVCLWEITFFRCSRCFCVEKCGQREDDQVDIDILRGAALLSVILLCFWDGSFMLTHFSQWKYKEILSICDS